MPTVELLPICNRHAVALHALTYSKYLISEKNPCRTVCTIWPYIHIYVYECIKKLRETYKMDNSDYLWEQERFVPFPFTLWCLSFYNVSRFPSFFCYLKRSESATETETLASCSGLCPVHPGLSNTLTQGWVSLLCWCNQKAAPSEAALPYSLPLISKGAHPSQHMHIIHIPLRHRFTQNSYCVG